jgi:hypothetical protein
MTTLKSSGKPCPDGTLFKLILRNLYHQRREF